MGKLWTQYWFEIISFIEGGFLADDSTKLNSCNQRLLVFQHKLLQI